MWVVLIGLPKNRGVLPVCSWIAEMPLSDSQVCALNACECRQSKSVGDSRRLVVKSVARGGVQIFGGAETLAASTVGPAGSCADTPGAPFLGPEGSCLRSLIAQRPLPLPFEEVATKFVPFSCPWEVMSREF